MKTKKTKTKPNQENEGKWESAQKQLSFSSTGLNPSYRGTIVAWNRGRVVSSQGKLTHAPCSVDTMSSSQHAQMSAQAITIYPDFKMTCFQDK